MRKGPCQSVALLHEFVGGHLTIRTWLIPGSGVFPLPKIT